MNNKKLIIRAEWIKEPKIHDFHEELSLKDIKQLLREYSELENLLDEEIFIFIENEDEEVTEINFKETIKKFEKHRFHGHRCKKIDVEVIYNGQEYCREFNPATTRGKIMHWLGKELNFTSGEMMHHELRVDSITGEKINDDMHLGIFIKYPQCKIRLFLVPKDRFEG